MNILRKFLAGVVASVALFSAIPAEASFKFDGNNDQLRGTLTTQRNGYPMTLACWIKYVDHPASGQTIFMVGDSASSNNVSQAIKMSGTDNVFQAASTASDGTTATANATVVALGSDNTWFGVVAVFTSATSRDLYVGTIGNTGNNTTNKAIANSIDDIAIGENLADSQDYGATNPNQSKVAHCEAWAAALNSTQIGNYLDPNDGVDPSAIGTPFFYSAQVTNSLANTGSDAGGALTASGDAVFDSDNPTFLAAPTFSGAFTFSSCDSDSCIYSFTPSVSSTLYYATYAPGASAPGTCAAVITHTNAINSGSKAVTGADTVDIPVLLAKQSQYACLSNAAGTTAVSSDLSRQRSARSGKTIVFPTSIGATSYPFIDTAAFAPDFAANDGVEFDARTVETADCEITMSAAALFTLAPGSGDPATSCNGRQTWNVDTEDMSTTSGLFTDPPTGNFTTSKLYCNLNTAPQLSDPLEEPQVLEEDAASTPLDIKSLFTVLGVATPTVTQDGDLPTGLSLANGVVSGTPTTENEAGVTVTFTITDECGDTATVDVDYFVVHTWAVPDIVGLPTEDGAEEICDAAGWRCEDVGLTVTDFVCDAGTAGLILTQDPEGGEQAGKFDPIEVTVSVSCESPPSGGESKTIFVLSSIVGKVKWVDYIPVKAVPGCKIGSFDDNGCLSVHVITSTVGKTEWTDYTPVTVVVSGKPWSYDDNGYIPVNKVVP